VSNRSVCCDDGVRVVIRQDRPWAAQQRHRPLSHFIPRRHAPAISVSTNPGLVDKLSVPLSTRTVISRLSTGWIIADAPHVLRKGTGRVARPTGPSPLGPFYKRALGTPVERFLVGGGDVYLTPKSATEVRAVRGATFCADPVPTGNFCMPSSSTVALVSQAT